MSEIFGMLLGKREAEWNHTGALIFIQQKLAGNKSARFVNPFADQGDTRSAFKKLIGKG